MPENEMHTTVYWLTVPARADARRCPTRSRSGATASWRSPTRSGQLAALFLMCDRHDLGVALGDNGQGEARIERGLLRLGIGHGAGRDEPPPGDDYEPNVFVYDNYPGGIGLSEPLYRLHDRLLAESRALIAACACARRLPVLRGARRARSAAGARKWPWRSSTRSSRMSVDRRCAATERARRRLGRGLKAAGIRP